MTLMARPALKKAPHPNRVKFPSAWAVIDQASVIDINSVMSPLPDNEIIKLTLPIKNVCIRNLIKECPHQIIWGLPSSKNNRFVQAQSHSELNMAHLLEAHPQVDSFVEQPFTITWFDKSGIHHKHTPDFSVILNNNTKIVIEVKPDSALDDVEVSERTQFFSKYLPTCHSMIYLLITTSQIEGQELENARIINKYHPIEIDQIDLYKIEKLFRKYDELTLDLIDSIAVKVGISVLKVKICSLIRKGEIRFDIIKPLTKSSPLYWRHNHE